MGKEETNQIVPEQITGKAIDATGSVEFNNERNAKEFFTIAKRRLKNVNDWADLAKVPSAIFKIVGTDGQEVDRAVKKGDYFKINVPGPGSSTGDGFDWVIVEDVEDKIDTGGESFGFRVRPTENPNNLKKDIAHFYSEESTSSFLVTRVGCVVSAAVKDRNTKPNENADSTIDKIRDAVVGAAGVFSFSKIQWQGLVDGLLQKQKR
ncbi:MAG: hypothetical protein WKF87_17690 [Chryseolinea sp.]